MSSLFIDPTRGHRKRQAALIIAFALAVSAAFLAGTLSHSTHSLETGRGLAIQYTDLPAGKYVIDLVVDEREGLVIATNVIPALRYPAKDPVQYFVKSVPSADCTKGHEFVFFDLVPR